MSSSTIDCEAVVRALWDYLDGRLPLARMQTISEHIRGCLGCKSHAEFEQRLLDLIGSARREPDDLTALEQRVRAALELDGR